MADAVYPGSFDPFTNGHFDIAKRALEVVDNLHIAILRNTSKKNLFTPDQRVELVKEVFENNPRVKVETFEGLLVDFCKSKNIKVVVRGLRAVSDFDYEHAIFLMNEKLLPGFETIFLMSSSDNSFISSSIVKEVSALGGNVEDQVPPAVFKKLNEIYNR